MLYVSWTHEREGREEALYVAYLLAVTGHVVSEHQNPCQVNFLAAGGAQGLQNDDRFGVNALILSLRCKC